LTVYVSNPFWVGIYDRATGILLAQDHSFWFIDDIMLHSLGLWQIGFPSMSLVLNSTNVAIVPDGSSSVFPSLAVGVGVTSVLAVAGALIWVRRAHGRAPKRGARG
jgi:protein-S-isoprenylcysteine O-methyltransferase Ste14